MSPLTNHRPELTVAERAALLRACHCEERKLLDAMEHYRDQVAMNYANAVEKLAVAEAELAILHSAIRRLWRA